jgi:hypothetical protein
MFDISPEVGYALAAFVFLVLYAKYFAIPRDNEEFQNM